jgi:hypothetical protein
MAVDDDGSHIDELAACVAGVAAEHGKARRLVDRVTFHPDSLGTFGNGATSKRAFEVLVLGEAAQGVDRALLASPSASVTYAKTPRWTPPSERLDRKRESGRLRAGGCAHDLLHEHKRVLGAAESNQRHVVTLARGDRAHVVDVDARRTSRRLTSSGTSASTLLDLDSNAGIAAWLPMSMLVMLVGFSTDAHLFIISRIRGLSSERAASSCR